MSTIRIEAPEHLSGQTAAMESKSMGHRLLIAAFLSGVEIEVTNQAEDIRATKACLAALGRTDEPLILPCRESGSTLRFLLPLVAALGKTAVFRPEGRLGERPLDELAAVLEEQGASIRKQDNEIMISGRLRAGTFRLPGHVSSQYVTGLLFALPLLSADSRIEIDGELQSEPYVRMSLEVLRLAGIEVRETGRSACFEISGGQTFRLPATVRVEEDWSNHAVWLAMGAIADAPIVNASMNVQSGQGDRRICEILRRFGASLTSRDAAGHNAWRAPWNGREKGVVNIDGCVDIWAQPQPLRGIEIDASQIPDLVPILSVPAVAAEGETKIYRAERLRLKESDRLEAIHTVLSQLGADVRVTRDGLLIKGTGRAATARPLRGGRVPSFGDHRIVMMAAAASLLCEGAIEIEGAEAVAKSYPHFWQECRRFGFIITEEE
ncbi:MAG: 3-phosphoshikimate 1-carboxyvinyltransferase [Eubacteriales bacterium]|nr:3-phosphoshikimate 1-carboxyvinyltransferase [Eubacteriales bacterium]